MSDVTDTRFGPPNFVSPLTKFIVALYKKPLAERMKADPVKAAEGYGLPVATTTWWIEQSRTCPDQWPMKT